MYEKSAPGPNQTRGSAEPVSGGQCGGACLRVPRDVSRLGAAAHCDGVDGGGVAIAVAVVPVPEISYFL
jgi:hypothetical protein